MSASVDQNKDGQLAVPSQQTEQSRDPGHADVDLYQAASERLMWSDQASGTTSAHQRLVFTDPVAFRYLEEDPATTVLERRGELVGYEVYIVEQWACSRVDPTFVITTYTGLPHHTVVVGVLSVPTNEDHWSPRLRVYLKAISKFHARRKETPLGILMVTNLSGFPSALNVIAVSGGNVRIHRENFIVNEDLKRLNCSGRAGMNLVPPAGATQSKFLQLYRTSDSIPLSSAVIELVKLCQVALVLFAKLAPEYADGLLCDVTERAINDWWTEVGIDYFNVEPRDGILGPTTVAALLGMLLGARNRLNAYGAPVGKDVFDLKAIKRGIAYFQKSQKISKTRRFDHQTLNLLHRATSKAANSEGWAVPRAVKSTVAELSGKGGEMVMGMVGARDKAGIAEVETLDMGSFVLAVSGERCRWLWHGKPRKNQPGDLFSALTGEDEMVFSGDEAGGYLWSSRKRDSVTEQASTGRGSLDHLYQQPSQSSQNSLEATDKDQAFRKTVLKSVTGKMSDARSGLGRFKDAVGIPGLRGHHHKELREDGTSTTINDIKRQSTSESQGQIDMNISQVSPSNDHSPRLERLNQKEPKHRVSYDAVSPTTTKNERSTVEGASFTHSTVLGDPRLVASPDIWKRTKDSSTDFLTAPFNTPVDQNSAIGGKELHSPTVTMQGSRNTSGEGTSIMARLLTVHSSQSLITLPDESILRRSLPRWPRQLSFSVVDDVLLGKIGQEWVIDGDDSVEGERNILEANEHILSLRTDMTAIRLRQLELRDKVWAGSGVRLVGELYQIASRDRDDLDILYSQKLEVQNDLRESKMRMVSDERVLLTEALKDIDGLSAKLEYELSALRSKVEDVEDGVSDFERQVQELELRASELENDEKGEAGWPRWLFHVILGRT